MTMSCIRGCWLLLMLLFAAALHSQEGFTGYWQPGISINYKVAPGYQHNFSITNRSYIYQNEDWDFVVRQLDLVHFSNWKFLDNQSLGFGLQYRFRKWFETDRGNELRLTQQYNITSRPQATRYGHRLRAEQRILKNLTVHRFRYRFAVDRPLSGEKLDIGESYLVGTSETLLSVAAGTAPQYDLRLGMNLGWLISNTGKIQAGLEYRIEDFTGFGNDVLFVNTTLVLSL
ncbi:MAG: DUF2490 domain-containing protein [Eudoraea sp.]|nr:DUF2490 domain-containing protein [Eudoraea sp.]